MEYVENIFINGGKIWLRFISEKTMPDLLSNLIKGVNLN